MTQTQVIEYQKKQKNNKHATLGCRQLKVSDLTTPRYMGTCQYERFLLPLSCGISRYEVFSVVFPFVSFALGKNTAYLTGCVFFFIIQKGSDLSQES